MGKGGHLRLRMAEAADWPAVAALQTETWRFAYRGILADSYLDGALAKDRRDLWRSRLASPAPSNQITILAERDGERDALAFACILGGHDEWGSLVDNLHVRPDLLRRGIGRLVLREAASRLVGGPFGDRPVHLTVYEQNRRAVGAYERYGGRLVERPATPQPDGGSYPLRRYLWDSPAALVARLGAIGEAA